MCSCPTWAASAASAGTEAGAPAGHPCRHPQDRHHGPAGCDGRAGGGAAGGGMALSRRRPRAADGRPSQPRLGAERGPAAGRQSGRRGDGGACRPSRPGDPDQRGLHRHAAGSHGLLSRARPRGRLRAGVRGAAARTVGLCGEPLHDGDPARLHRAAVRLSRQCGGGRGGGASRMALPVPLRRVPRRPGRVRCAGACGRL